MLEIDLCAGCDIIGSMLKLLDRDEDTGLVNKPYAEKTNNDFEAILLSS